MSSQPDCKLEPANSFERRACGLKPKAGRLRRTSNRPHSDERSSPSAHPQPSQVRPADRLGFTLFVATVLHVALILGLGFSLSEPRSISKTLEITLSTFRSEKQPEQADFLAQDNQQGSGTLEHKAAPKTTEQAPFHDTEVRKVSPPATPPRSVRQEAPKAAVATRAPQPDKTPVKRQEKPQPEPQPTPAFDSSQLSAEIASLEAELAQDIERYAKRPRVNRQNSAATMRDISAWYRDEWRKRSSASATSTIRTKPGASASTAACGCS